MRTSSDADSFEIRLLRPKVADKSKMKSIDVTTVTLSVTRCHASVKDGPLVVTRLSQKSSEGKPSVSIMEGRGKGDKYILGGGPWAPHGCSLDHPKTIHYLA